MKILHRVASVFGWIVNRNRAEVRLNDEMQSFVEMAAAEKIRDGVAPAEARRQARLELGGVEQVKEQVRTGRYGHLIDEVARDVRYAARMFARTPTFTAAVVLTLAIGIGANTAIFGLIDALMWRTLPVQRPHELVQINLRERGATGPGGESFSYAILRGLDDQRDIFAGVAGFASMAYNIPAGGGMTRVPGALVTGGYYETLGIPAAAGRLLTRADDRPGAPLVAVISDGFWSRQFGRRPEAVGRTMESDGVAITIVGVAPSGFAGTEVGAVADITMPVAAIDRLRPALKALLEPGNFWLRALARPQAGLSPDLAAVRLNARWPELADAVIAPHWTAARRQAMADSVFQFEPGATGFTGLRGTYEKPLYVLMAAVGLVLLIACANIASLFLARASVRQREIAVRLAIGAGRMRIVRQLLIESTLLACIGAALGVGLAWLSSGVLVDLISRDVVFDLTPNWRVLLFAGTAAVGTGILFGLAPVRQTMIGAAAALRHHQRTTTRRSRLLPSLVSAQVALSIVLLAGAGLLARTLVNLRSVDPGFRADNVLVVRLERRATPSPAELLEVVRRVPGVVVASVTTHTPLDGWSWTEPAAPVPQPVPEVDNTRIIAADPEFFETMRIDLVAGRRFTDQDVAGRPAVALLNERYAERFFAGQNPIGQRLASKIMGKPQEFAIVGVVKNTVAAGLRFRPPSIVYLPFAQFDGPLDPSLAIRTTDAGAPVARAIRAALQAMLPSTVITLQPMTAQITGTIVQERMMATLSGAFGLVALALASIGLYGLLAYSVAQQSREIGIRMALGSQPSGVVRLVLAKGAWLVGIGLGVGLPAAWGASRWIESMLFGLKPTDPLTIGSAVMTLVCAALISAYLPARRAARVDPLIALRQD